MVKKVLDDPPAEDYDSMRSQNANLRAALEWLVNSVTTMKGLDLNTKPRITFAVSQAKSASGFFGPEIHCHTMITIEHPVLGELGVQTRNCKIRRRAESGELRFYWPARRAPGGIYITDNIATKALADLFLALALKTKAGKKVKSELGPGSDTLRRLMEVDEALESKDKDK